MHCPRLSHLPQPPSGKTGWPWTEETEFVDRSRSISWPKISVITPSYNQGKFLEQTIRSVLLQGYPNLEYIIIDGGSSDESVNIIKRYEQFLTFWVSERDRGQSHAINKGFARSTGEIMCWLNSDDFYLPGTLLTVAENLTGKTPAGAVVGHCIQVYEDGRPPYRGTGQYSGLERLLQFWKGYQMHQPSIFWKREVFEKVGYLDESHHYIMDFDYWVRMARHYEFKNIDRELSCATYPENAKTGDAFLQYKRELRKHATKYWPSPFTVAHWRLKLSMVNHLYFLPIIRRIKNSFTYRLSEAHRSAFDSKGH
jgi:glycosyltransferase involved in cell wall biosynthesis